MKNGNLYQHRRHNKNLLMVHLIFVTKYRKKLFYGNFREAVKQYIFDACKDHHWYIRRMETDKDHIHILLQYNPTDSITNIVSLLKQYIVHTVHGKIISLCYSIITGNRKPYGRMGILQHPSDRFLKLRLNITSKIRDEVKPPHKGAWLQPNCLFVNPLLQYLQR